MQHSAAADRPGSLENFQQSQQLQQQQTWLRTSPESIESVNAERQRSRGQVKRDQVSKLSVILETNEPGNESTIGRSRGIWKQVDGWSIASLDNLERIDGWVD